MTTSIEVKKAQLETAVHYLAGLLEEGSLIQHYDPETRREIAEVLELMLAKVNGLPDNVPDNLVQAAVVRAIVGAAENLHIEEALEREVFLNRQMREVEAFASIHGHTLTGWEPVSGEEGVEYQSSCRECGGFVYVSLSGTYNLLLDSCERM
ncbi:MAG: hypothetical protein H6659_12375 [Ardenticatenaceae bacterium]|nr:hypothetical protein [Anaerolineales bacterium]MCB8984615.1 hypothetical protein [Ardenticatenaceae bacterium]